MVHNRFFYIIVLVQFSILSSKFENRPIHHIKVKIKILDTYGVIVSSPKHFDIWQVTETAHWVLKVFFCRHHLFYFRWNNQNLSEERNDIIKILQHLMFNIGNAFLYLMSWCNKSLKCNIFNSVKYCSDCSKTMERNIVQMYWYYRQYLKRKRT